LNKARASCSLKTLGRKSPVLDKQAVEKVAKLARLKLSEDEISLLSQQLSAVLENFDKISEVKTDGTLPLVTPSEIAPFLRSDLVEEEKCERMLDNAVEKAGRLFKVPPVV
jgi:aspartyl-tRNA(Asn)/glutamyl-tRNA(Gln) amidotransferase subunit C